MSLPFHVPDGNAIVDRIPPSEIRGVGSGAPCEAVAQYHADHVMDNDLTLTVLNCLVDHDVRFILIAQSRRNKLISINRQLI